jgi:hypothetical protein
MIILAGAVMACLNVLCGEALKHGTKESASKAEHNNGPRAL